MCNPVYKDLLVALLYDDLNDMDRAKVDMHLRACEECRAELTALRGVRVDLAAWAPPLPDLGFRIVRDAKHLGKDDAKQLGTENAKDLDTDARSASKPSWRTWWTPAAGLAAAATLVMAAALSIAHVEIHSGADGITVRTGWSTSAPDSASGSLGPVRRVVGHDQILPSDQMNPASLAGIVQRVDALEAVMKQAPLTRNASALDYRAADEALIKRVREMLSQSESRQQGELALRIAHVIRDFENQRRVDLSNIQAGFARLDNNMTKEAAMHADLVTYVTNTAGKQK